MLILVKRLLKVFKREHELLARYERAHPHFIRYLAIDAIISVVIVCVGFQIYESHSASTGRLSHSGNLLMSSGQLVDHLRKDGIRAYWLGPIAAEEYTLNHESEGIVDLMYFPKGTAASDDSTFDYEIKTYRNQQIWDAHTHPILASANTKTINLNAETFIRINPTSMKGVIVRYTDKPEIVAIAYSSRRTLQAIMKDVEALKLIR